MELFFEKAEMFLTRSGFYLKSAYSTYYWTWILKKGFTVLYHVTVYKSGIVILRNEYTYDSNGILTKDSNKGITNITYK